MRTSYARTTDCPSCEKIDLNLSDLKLQIAADLATYITDHVTDFHNEPLAFTCMMHQPESILRTPTEIPVRNSSIPSTILCRIHIPHLSYSTVECESICPQLAMCLLNDSDESAELLVNVDASTMCHNQKEIYDVQYRAGTPHTDTTIRCDALFSEVWDRALTKSISLSGS